MQFCAVFLHHFQYILRQKIKCLPWLLTSYTYFRKWLNCAHYLYYKKSISKLFTLLFKLFTLFTSVLQHWNIVLKNFYTILCKFKYKLSVVDGISNILQCFYVIIFPFYTIKCLITFNFVCFLNHCCKFSTKLQFFDNTLSIPSLV